jgi:GDPmannose 4,6-dehydratase
VDYLCADITKAKEQLHWQPKIKFHNLIKIMVDYDLRTAGIIPPGEGIKLCEGQWFGYNPAKK